MAMRGVARGYSTASPGLIPRFIAQEKVANSLVLVDEVDKCATGRHNGSLFDVLLQLLEPAISTVYYDEALEVRLDLSHMNWIATAIICVVLQRSYKIKTPINGCFWDYLIIDLRSLFLLTSESAKRPN